MKRFKEWIMIFIPIVTTKKHFVKGQISCNVITSLLRSLSVAFAILIFCLYDQLQTVLFTVISFSLYSTAVHLVEDQRICRIHRIRVIHRIQIIRSTLILKIPTTHNL